MLCFNYASCCQSNANATLHNQTESRVAAKMANVIILLLSYYRFYMQVYIYNFNLH